MPNVRNVLVVGGGIAGMSAAIMLTRSGVKVDLIDLDPNWRAYGTGITITGPTLRAFKVLGILDDIKRLGNTDDLPYVLYDAQGHEISRIDVPRIAPDIAIGGGIMRPILHKILADRVTRAGAHVRLGLTVDRFEDRGGEVHVTFTDGSSELYDLVIGADGVHSHMRKLLFPDAPVPKLTGQSVWRAVAPRAADYTPSLFMADGLKVGINAVSKDEVYLFLLETRKEDPWIPEAEQWHILKDLLSPFSGEVAKIRERINPSSYIIYRPLEALLVPAPWYRGRVVLIGDTVHATTPQLASGAGVAVEDAIILAEMLDENDVPAALQKFMARRFERCRTVVESSLQIGEIEMQHKSGDRKALELEYANVSARAWGTLMAPI